MWDVGNGGGGGTEVGDVPGDAVAPAGLAVGEGTAGAVRGEFTVGAALVAAPTAGFGEGPEVAALPALLPQAPRSRKQASHPSKGAARWGTVIEVPLVTASDVSGFVTGQAPLAGSRG